MDLNQSGGGPANSSSDFNPNPSDENVVRWGDQGDSFVVLENERFTKNILPKHFKHSNFASFVRQLNKYDFHKVRHNNEENGQSPYGSGAWEFKHPDFKANNKDALDNIRRKAPAPRKPNPGPDDMMPVQQMDMFNSQLVATQQQLQALQDRYAELSIHHSMLLQELIGVQKTVVNHEHVMQSVMSFLHSVDAQRRRDSRAINPFHQQANGDGASSATANPAPAEEDVPASPLQHASKLLSETNADVMLNPRNLEHMSEMSIRMNGTLTTPPPDFAIRASQRPASRNAPHSATSSTSMRMGELENLVYPVGQNNGIDPMFSEHIHNIPYSMPPKGPEQPDPRTVQVDTGRKKSQQFDPGWIRQPHILLVEDDPTCRRIGGKFLYAFNCAIDSALDGLEAVNKMHSGAKYDLVLMDIIMPNLDGVSACHLIRQFDPTPIIAMTSNIRTDDIQMYFNHGMNDVLPKPFTKEGLLLMLEKHLAHLKKGGPTMDAMGAPTGPPIQHASARTSLKEDDSPGKSEATASNWASPSQMPGVSPVGSEEFMQHHVQGHPGAYGIPTPGGMPFNPQHQVPLGQRAQQGHRRQISDISGPEDPAQAAKRQQIRKGGSTEKSKSVEEERREPLQAVILADPFETRFRPFTLERPRCLLPLANIPLIEYTFEFLANAGVEEVYIYCGAHQDQVEDYIKNQCTKTKIAPSAEADGSENLSKWASPSSPFSHVEIIRSTSDTVGDAMRALDQRNILVNDFILVYGDVVSNFPLEGALAAHRARKAADKHAVMTVVLREAGVAHRSKAQGTSPVFVIDPSKNRCLHYDHILPGQESRYVNLDAELLSEHPEIEVRTDLIDCGIDICTPDSLAQWTEHFDYEAPRRNYLKGVLEDYELNGLTIHTHIISDHYAARVRNFQAYDSISKDILSRWTYPLCPDSNLLQGQTYQLQKGNMYKEDGVILARSCTVGRKTVIGKDTSVGDGSVITNSIIGRRCQIGKNVTIDGAYIWEDTVIGDGSTVTQAIVAAEAQIGKRCTIEPGALLSYGVRVSEGMTIRRNTRLTRVKRKREDGESFVAESDVGVVGEKGEGYVYGDSDDETEDSEIHANTGLAYNMASLALSNESISTLQSEEDDIDFIDRDRSARESIHSVGSEESGVRHATDFHHEAVKGIVESLEKGDETENIALELNSLRMATNASFHQLRRAVAESFMKRISQVMEEGVPTQEAVKNVLPQHKGIFPRILFDKNKAEKEDQKDFLLSMQTDLVKRKNGDLMFVAVAIELYNNMEVIEAEGLEEWWEDEKSQSTDELRRVREKMKVFIERITEESSEEEDSDDEDEESDED
ncbi:hypothetical protein K402DRAFT_413249 [Aulographum hederae CBS 113979]|uniref:Mannose-1-phosphate guanyltransferase n=1 Tax=Aulographum hederae CBS 113979 TaxID=1176131 RepID=A0A6G1GX83_9PEZI|nr:hypothetical protein K402DRAFT_413249 [Aulographum hederae CBS 113979]